MFPRRVQLHPCLFWQKTCGRERILGRLGSSSERGGRGLRVWAQTGDPHRVLCGIWKGLLREVGRDLYQTG